MKAQSASIPRVARALDALARSQNGAAIDELAAELEISRPAALRLFESMIETGLAVRTDAKRYRLSLRAYEWGTRSLAAYAPTLPTRQEMARLAAQIRHRVWYAVMEGASVVTIERMEFIDGLTMSFPVANRSQWWLSASGMIIAAFSADPVREELVERARAGSEMAELTAALADMRHKGLARRSYGDLGFAVAAPVLDASGYAVGAIGITTNTEESLIEEDIERQLSESAARCSHYLGHSRMLFVT